MATPLHAFLRANFWLVPLPMIAAIALCNASAISQLIGAAVAPSADDLARPPGGALHARAAVPTRSLDPTALLKRNPFDSVTGSLLPKAAASSEASEAAPVDDHDPMHAPVCDGVSVDAIVESSDEDWSFASLAGSDGKHHLVRRDAELADKKVYYISWNRVWLTSGGALCQVELMAEKKKTPAPAPSAAPTMPPVANSRAKALDPDLAKGIQKVSATEWNIDRGVVDRILENQADLMRQARIVPVQENGKVVGIKLNGVRPDALLGVLGMQNGDQLNTINGFEMGSPEKALEAYARLRTADKLQISLVRGGKPVNLDYNIK